MDYLSKKFDLDNPAIAPIIDELSLWSAYFTQLLLDNIEMKPNLAVLDVGFGTGVPLFELAQRLGESCRLTGIDSWEAGVERARWKKEVYGLKNVEIICADAADMPFEDATFDMVTSNLGINNFADPAKTVAECHRVLKNGGKLVMTTNLTGHFGEFYRSFEQVLKKLGKKALLPKLKAQEAHRGSLESVRELLESACFSIQKIIKDRFHWRYLDGSAMLRHSLTVFGFLDGWRKVIEGEDELLIFLKIEEKLNDLAESEGELKMTVPMVYVEGVK